MSHPVPPADDRFIPYEEPARDPNAPGGAAEEQPPQPVYEMQPGFEIHTQPHLPEPDLDHHLQQLTPTVWVTYLLIAINVIVFVVMVANGYSLIQPTTQDVINWGGSYPPRTFLGEPWRLFTACFLHLDLVHIAGNMVSLFVLGPRLERMVGHWGFLVGYLICGIVGEVASSAWNPYLVSVGASGAIYGVVGMQLVILFTQPATPLQSALKNAWWGILGFLGYSFFYGFGQPSMDHAAHFGGLIAGVLCGLVLSQPLELTSVENRWLRDACLAIAAPLVFLGGYLAAEPFSEPAIEWVGAVDEFVRVHDESVGILKKEAARIDTKELTEIQFAEILDKQILAPFSKMVVRLSHAKTPNNNIGAHHKKLLGYVELRQKSWEVLSQALKDSTPKRQEIFNNFVQLRDQSDALFSALSEHAGK